MATFDRIRTGMRRASSVSHDEEAGAFQELWLHHDGGHPGTEGHRQVEALPPEEAHPEPIVLAVVEERQAQLDPIGHPTNARHEEGGEHVEGARADVEPRFLDLGVGHLGDTPLAIEPHRLVADGPPLTEALLDGERAARLRLPGRHRAVLHLEAEEPGEETLAPGLGHEPQGGLPRRISGKDAHRGPAGQDMRVGDAEGHTLARAKRQGHARGRRHGNEKAERAHEGKPHHLEHPEIVVGSRDYNLLPEEPC